MRSFLTATLALVLVGLGWLGAALAAGEPLSREEIRDYEVSVTVEPDGGISVVEDIEVVALGYEIKRGIYRDIPVGGIGLLGLGRAPFDLIETLRDGQREPNRIERTGGNVRIYLGDPDVYLTPGVYRYRIAYRMGDQVRHFDGFDEIYWNATGNQWTFPIEKARVTVTPPAGAPVTQVAVYTGYSGASGTDAEIGESAAGEPTFSTIRQLLPGQGITVAVGWPPGFVAAESAGSKFSRWVERWGSLVAACGTLALVLAYYAVVWFHVGRDPRSGPVIPIYHPEIPPAAMRFIERMGYDDTCFAAAVVDLAVKGHLRVEEQNSKQTLVAVEDGDGKPISEGEEKLFDGLFSSGDRVTIQRSSRSRLNAAANALKAHFTRTFDRIYFHRNRGWFALGVVLTVLGWLASTLIATEQIEFLFLAILPTVVAIVFGSLALQSWRSVRDYLRTGELASLVGAALQAVILTVMLTALGGAFAGIGTQMGLVPFLTLIGIALLNVVFWYLLKAPTAIGRSALDQIEGTRLYLSVAEADRLKFANPPDRTPEHFHELLPYAIALDVETDWTNQFRDEIAAARAEDGRNAYLQPSWYSGSSGDGFRDTGALRAFGANLGSAYSSATVSRSSGSGSSGGGSSGGGGGGGGGGGW
jgi:uncharacterized membrane protein YgcG